MSIGCSRARLMMSVLDWGLRVGVFSCFRVFSFQFSVFLLRAPIINSLYIGVSVHAVKSNVVHYYSHNNITVK